MESNKACVALADVSALLVVALDGTRDSAQLQMVEFGRGFGYKLPLSIGMHSVGSTILQQIVGYGRVRRWLYRRTDGRTLSSCLCLCRTPCRTGSAAT